MSRLRLIWLGVVAVGAGCGLESPQSPSFETAFYVPLAEQRYTGDELAAGLTAIEGDSAQPGPLSIHISQSLAPVYLDDHIKISMAHSRQRTSLQEIAYDPPQIAPVVFRAADLLPGELPLGEPIVFEACTFQSDPLDLGTFPDFEEVVMSEGTLLVTLTNGFPVSLENAAISVVDDQGRTLAHWDHTTGLAAQGEVDGSVDLGGIEMSHGLILTLSGTFVGTGQMPITVPPDASIGVELRFQGVEVRSLTGPLPSFSLATVVAAELDEQIAIEEATVASGELRFSLMSGLPVDVTVLVSAPDLEIGSEPFTAELVVPAEEVGELVIDLTNEILTVRGEDAWHWEVSVFGGATGQTGTLTLDQEIEVALNAGDLHFSTLRGRVDQLAFDLPVSESAIEFPEGTDDVDFTAVDAEITMSNRAGVCAVAQLELIGRRGTETVRVPFAVDLPAGSVAIPGIASAVLDESNSDILELLALRPAQVTVAGEVRIGDGSTTVQIAAGDYLDGEFQLLAPMKLVLETARQEGEPFAIELDEELREQVTEKLIAITIQAEVENHFPTRIDLTFHFAKTSEALFVNDDLTLDGEMIASAVVAEETGRVTEASCSEVMLSVAAGDLSLFAEEELFGGLEIVLQGDGATAVEIWSTDYVRIKGIAAFRYRVE